MKRNFIFKAYDSKGNEISLKCGNIFYGLTEREALLVKTGMVDGLSQKYQNPKVICRQPTEEELKEYEERLHKALGL